MKVSVIIPAYNEEKYIEKCLQAISQLTLKPFETIVVDNGSTDATTQIVRSFPNVRLISYTEKQGPNAARETGFRASTGEIVVMLDADNIPFPEWISRGIEPFSNQKVVAVYGSCKYDKLGSPWWGPLLNDFITYIVLPIIHWYLRIQGKGFATGGNSFIRRSSLEAIGGFNVNIPFHGDDTDTGTRLANVGKIVYKPSLTIRSSNRRYRELGILKTLVRYSYFLLAPKKGERKYGTDAQHPR